MRPFQQPRELGMVSPILLSEARRLKQRIPVTLLLGGPEVSSVPEV